MAKRAIELLAPARDKECGIAAINHGADSVYIGGPQFGARSAAGNSLNDIEQVVKYAHQFRAKVYVALNTLLTDHELEKAVKLIYELESIGIDGLIIQDIGLLEADLPPVPLHSSTQMNNRTVEKIEFLEAVGFQQVVLARELSLESINKIRKRTSITLEFFIHGALCVSYSGQCYISEVIAGRSANRGECAQFCRHKFDLRGADGRILQKDRHLLSLKDLDLSRQLKPLIDAGIGSFKIEGRLKGANYVKNVTAYYRQALDKIFQKEPDLLPSSSGACEFTFQPDPKKSFSRGKTEYFLRDPKNNVGEIRTPKSIGKRLGRVNNVNKKFFTIDSIESLSNGDGLCFFNQKQVLVGIKVNRVEGQKIFPRTKVTELGLKQGTVVYRNFDFAFAKELEASKFCRTIGVKLSIIDTDQGLTLQAVDEDGLSVTKTAAVKKQLAQKDGIDMILTRQLKKSGGTIFRVVDIFIDVDTKYHYTLSEVNGLRRAVLEDLARLRQIQQWSKSLQKSVSSDHLWPEKQIGFWTNVTNKKAAKFLARHGVPESALARTEWNVSRVKNATLMSTKYCVKTALNACPYLRGTSPIPDPVLLLNDHHHEYEVFFNCKKCEMVLRKKEK